MILFPGIYSYQLVQKTFTYYWVTNHSSSFATKGLHTKPAQKYHYFPLGPVPEGFFLPFLSLFSTLLLKLLLPKVCNPCISLSWIRFYILSLNSLTWYKKNIKKDTTKCRRGRYDKQGCWHVMPRGREEDTVESISHVAVFF